MLSNLYFRSTAVLLSLALLLFACSSPPEQILSGKTMGTTFNIKYVPIEEGITPELLLQQVNQKLIWVNDLMSTWQADSQLSQFNDSRSLQPFSADPALIKVVNEAVRLHTLSDGAYDVTAGKVFSLWGFDKQARPKKVPTTDEINQARALSGIDKLVVDNTTISKKLPELYINLSSLAKGYGVDVIGEVLEGHGINNYLVEIGGETRLRGEKSNGKKWRIAIEKPVSFERAIQRVVETSNMSIATSGDYRIYFEEDGVRYSHLIDPRTAKPITHNLVSVTVLHPSCMTADGLATLFNVLGAEQSLAIAEQHKLPVLLITKEKDGFKEQVSSAMQQYL